MKKEIQPIVESFNKEVKGDTNDSRTENWLYDSIFTVSKRRNCLYKRVHE